MGEASFAYHGANRIGGNAILSRVFDGLFGGSCVKHYCADAAAIPSADVPQAIYDAVVKQETDRAALLLANDGNENPYLLCQELGEAMTAHCTVVRDNAAVEQTLERCREWKERCGSIKLTDASNWSNQSLPLARATRDMIVMSEAILKAALLRNESRGAHYKPAHPERDDANFLKATIAVYDPAADSPRIGYETVDTSLIAPKPQSYGRKTAATVAT
jgi:succinate dehydrogenase / fumarate reductase flavoprotein subunit